MAMELPSDLLEEILSRVPASSLARLRYTCKKWETLIADPRFVNKHLSRMRSREQEYRVFSDVRNSVASCFLGSTVSCVGIDFDELKKPCLNLQVFTPVSSPNLYVRFLFHCDGLLLFVMPSRVLVLNPLLKQERWVHIDYGFDHDVDAYGLGYISNQCPYDYRIVRFRCGDSSDPKTQVYDFKYETWKTVVDKTFNGFLELPLSSVCLRGTPYWIGYYENKTGDKTFSMQSFDFSKERFEAFSLPVSLHKPDDDDALWLWIFRGDQLSLVHESHSNRKIHVWVMKKNEKHFTNLMTLDVSRSPTFPRYTRYFIENNGELVLCTHHLDGRSISIHIGGDGEECQIVEYNSVMDRTIDGCSYVPSLLQVPGFPKQEEEEDYEEFNDYVL